MELIVIFGNFNLCVSYIQIEMYHNCVSVMVGEFTQTNKNGDFVMNYNEQRKLCQERGNYSFIYGTGIGSNYLEFSGKTVKPEEKTEKIVFNVTISVNKKKKEERTMTYQEVIDLFEKEKKNHLFIDVVHKYLPIVQKQFIEGRPALIQGPQRRGPLIEEVTEEETRKITQKGQRKQRPSQLKQSGQRKQLMETGKIKLEPGKLPDTVINPNTGREIKIGGDTYNELCRSGLYIC